MIGLDHFDQNIRQPTYWSFIWAFDCFIKQSIRYHYKYWRIFLFDLKGTVSSSAASSSLSTPSSRFGTTSSASSAGGGTASTTPVTPRFQSRFLGRAGTPTAEASRGSENSQSNSSSDDSSESESNDSDQHQVIIQINWQIGALKTSGIVTLLNEMKSIHSPFSN